VADASVVNGSINPICYSKVINLCIFLLYFFFMKINKVIIIALHIFIYFYSIDPIY
jgi:hypothetical protein